MERKVLVLALLQSLSIFASADLGITGTSMDDWIGPEMAGMEEYTRTLPTVESPPTNAVLVSGESRENPLPFGALTIDWVRLNLLRDALPRDSAVKKKFKHLVRILRFAYDEATRFSFKSTKCRTAEKSTTASVSTKKEENVRHIDESESDVEVESLSSSTRATLVENSTKVASVDLSLETLSTSKSISISITLPPNHAEDDVVSVGTKNINQNTTSRENEEKTTIRADIQHTGSDDSKVELFTIFDTNVGSSTETMVKEAFDRPVTNEQYFSSDMPSKALNEVQDQSSSSTLSGRGSERTNEQPEAGDSISSHRLSTETISTKKTPMFGEYTSTITVSNAVLSRNQSSYSSSSENLETSTRAEKNIDSPESVTMISKEQNSTQEEYSSLRTSRFETTEFPSLDSSRKQKILASTTEQNLSAELTPATIPVDSSEKSLVSVPTIPSFVTKGSESLTSATQSQSTSEVKLPAEEKSSSIKEFSTTSSSPELYTNGNIGLTENSRESLSIDTPHKNEEIEPVNYVELSTTLKTTVSNEGVSSSTPNSTFTLSSSTEEIKRVNYAELVTSLKTTGSNEGVSSSTPNSTFTSSSSTDSKTTTHYIDDQSKAVSLAKASDLPIEVQHLNKNNTSEVVTEQNIFDKRPTAAPVAEASDSPIEVQYLNKNDASKDVTERNTVDDPVQAQTGSTTEKSERPQKATDKPSYIKNPLHTDSSRSNHHIFRDYRHRSEDSGTHRSPQSEEIILYESGGNANTANVWRPHVVKLPPVRNIIWRFDKIPESAKPYSQQRTTSSGSKTNFNAESPSSPVKLPFPSRTNALTPRKRGNANADVEKQFRWFYTQRHKEPSNKSRNDDNHNMKITIQCKSTQ